MGKYLIADLVIEIKNKYNYLAAQCAQYKCSEDAPADISVQVTAEEINRERLRSEYDFSDGYLESICAYRALCFALPRYNAMLLHASTISVKNKGVAFLARSGVGKTTHTFLWRKLLGDSLTVINGDKPILRFFDGAPYVYGTPWAGKEKLQTNARAELTDLCFIERSKTNYVEKLTADGCLDRIMSQVLLPSDAQSLTKTLELTDMLLNRCNLWLIHCNTDSDAAKTAYSTIIEGDF